MAAKIQPIDQQLKEIKTFAKAIKKAAKWNDSGDTLLHIETHKTDKKKREYIYEFFCYIRILKDLKANYEIEFIKGGTGGSQFPKAPGLKKNFPFFRLTNKTDGTDQFDYCAGIKVKGKAKEYSAPDISFILDDKLNDPDYTKIKMLHDAKYKHSAKAKVSDGEFYKVGGMIRNLDCESKIGRLIAFDQFTGPLDLNGNFILTNGKAFKENKDHHALFSIKEAENFDIKKKPKIFG
ncbi:MAG: hypothetical protein ABJG68_01560 [Crocinitomicaceae bacterium]